MFVMDNMDHIKDQLKKTLPKDEFRVIQQLKEFLSKTSEKFDLVIAVEGRLNFTNRQRILGVIDDKELQLEYNRVRKDLLEIINALSEKDFESNETGKEDKSNSNRGRILYRIPRQMELGERVKCIVRLAIDDEKISKNIKLDASIKIKSVRISDVMQVTLIDPSDAPFSIQSISKNEQIIFQDGEFTEWIFYVRPLLEGTFPLIIKVAVIELINGKEQLHEIVLEEHVKIKTYTVQEEEVGEEIDSGQYFSLSSEGVEDSKVLQSKAPSSQTRSYKRLFIRWTMTLASILFLVFAGWAFDIPQEFLYQMTKKSNSKTKLNSYLKKYPKGKYVDEVKSKLEILDFQEIEEEIKKKDTTNVQKFEMKYPNSSIFKDSIDMLIHIYITKKPLNVSEEDDQTPETETVGSSGNTNSQKGDKSTTGGSQPSVRKTKQYKTIRIGNQYWMKENLKEDVGEGSWCYDDLKENCEKYGRLYSFSAAKRACPLGWRLPTRKDWEELIANYGQALPFDEFVKDFSSSEQAFSQMIDHQGFNAIFAGVYSGAGNYDYKNVYGYYWGDGVEGKNPTYYIFDNKNNRLFQGGEINTVGYSCRCIKD